MKTLFFLFLPLFAQAQLEKLSWARLGDSGPLFAACFIESDSVFAIAGGSAFNLSAINTKGVGCSCNVVADNREIVFRCGLPEKKFKEGVCVGPCAISFSRKNQFIFKQ